MGPASQHPGYAKVASSRLVLTSFFSQFLAKVHKHTLLNVIAECDKPTPCVLI